ncbi:MAG: MiaB/RimO family radical SAM methylthiotransferase [Chloroflexi bacterium]|nr:MiaB/RimO family radical SAM methylthiotransferase [Chloroflexota bacterium]
MNKADSERLASLLEERGLVPALSLEVADVVVLNSCSVRQSAEERVHGRLSSLKSLKMRRPDTLIALMGCMVGGDPRELRGRYPHVAAFLNVLKPASFLEMVEERQGLRLTEPGLSQTGAAFATGGLGGRSPLLSREEATDPEHSLQEPTESVVKGAATAGPVKYIPIIYGCDNFCSYCIVPFRRGREVSRPLPEIVCEVENWTRRGVREVTLLGQNVDSYGHDLPGRPDLADLLSALHHIPGLWRIRFLTSHPKDISDRLIDAMSSLPKVCESINLPVQSGDDAVLQGMGRGYTVDGYRKLVDKVREHVPGISVTTDLIVGFPGETEAQFYRSFALLQEIRFDLVHVAAYSPRPGTRAARMPDDVPSEEKKRRLALVEELQTAIATEINSRLSGQEVEVLVERQAKGKWTGRTRTDKIVFFQDEGDWTGRLVTVKITRTSPWSLQGELVQLAVGCGKEKALGT